MDAFKQIETEDWLVIKKYLDQFPITFIGVDTNPYKYAKNLGVVFDQDFNIWKHISRASCYYHIYGVFKGIWTR